MPATGSDAWIRRYHPAGETARRLVCFPHAGGAASFYFPLSAALNPGIEVLAVQYPGRQDRRCEAPITDIQSLADGIFQALDPWRTSRLALFGHSMGATVAFEVARRLEREAGQTPVVLIASGRRAPSLWREERVHRLDDAGMISELKQLSGTHSSLFQDQELMAMFLPAVRGDYQALESYVCPPDDARLDCPITVFLGDADPRVTLDEANAWREHTAGRFDLHVFEGDHFYLAAQPDEIAGRVASVLRASAAHV